MINKFSVLLFLIFSLLLNFNSLANAQFEEINFSSGFAIGELKARHDLKMYTLQASFRFNADDFFHVKPSHNGHMQFLVEPYLATHTAPTNSVSGGLLLGVHYSYPLNNFIQPYFEIGSGPMILGINTHEQDKSGFNFYTQAGAGIEIPLSETKSLSCGYRFGHISHAHLRNTSNGGINTHNFQAGLTLKF